MVNQLDRVHARVLVIELLRDTAPAVQVWSDALLGDGYEVLLEAALELSRELARRSDESH